MAFNFLQNDLAFHLRVKQEYVPSKFDHNLVMTTCGLLSQDYDHTPDNHSQECKVRTFLDVKTSSNRVSNSWLRVKKVPCKKPLRTWPRIDLSFK